MQSQASATVLKFNRPAMQSEESSLLETGFIKLYRSLQDSSFSSRPEYLATWVHILMLATHKPRKTMLGSAQVTLTSGQFISGRNSLSERVGVSPQTMRTILSFFESEGMILRESSRQGTVFTVVNYLNFQGEKAQKINQRPPTNINQRSTNNNSIINNGLSVSEDSASTNDQPTQSTTTQENNKYISISKDIDCAVSQVSKAGKNDVAMEVLDYLNLKAKKRFSHSDSHFKFINARLKEKKTVEDLKAVIDLKVKEWASDSKMKSYLRPKTLFNSENFDGYLGEALDSSSSAKSEIDDLMKQQLDMMRGAV